MGIGKTMATELLKFGAKVIVTGRNQERLNSFQQEMAGFEEQLMIHQANVADHQENILLVNAIIARFGRLDVLINNAAMSTDFGEVEYIQPKVIHEMIDTNIKGSMFASMAAIPEIKKRQGSIIFISTIAAFRGLPAYSLYSLTKMALTSLVQSLKIETKKDQVFIGIAYLGFTENEPDKRTLSHDGQLVKIAERNKLLTSTRLQTAHRILTQIANRKARAIHSPLGKITYVISNYFPFLAGLIHTRIYNKQKKLN